LWEFSLHATLGHYPKIGRKPRTTAWPATTFERRMLDCLAMLLIYDAITPSESKAIKKRLVRIIREHKAK
jgi:hypothetical protein